MSGWKNMRAGADRERSRPGLFVSGMAIAVAGFILIWAPGQGLMFTGAIISFGGTVFLSVEAWRLAARRWKAARGFSFTQKADASFHVFSWVKNNGKK